MTTNLHAIVTDHADAVTTLTDALRRGRAYRWETPPSLAPEPVGVPVRPSQHPDPTADIATDPRRLRLSAAVAEAELLVERATAALRRAEARLTAALRVYDDDAAPVAA